jgi:hypothetical protein
VAELRRGRRRLVVGATAAGLVTALAGAATAGFTARSSSASLPVRAAVLQPATGLQAAAGCSLLTARAVLTWTATPSTYATGYRVLRRTGATGAFVPVAELTGRTTTTFTDAPLVVATSYAYRVDAVYRGWSATGTTTAGVTTPVLCL